MIKKYWAIFCILAVWFAFASPYFLQNKVPYPSTYQVDAFSPWSRYDKYADPVKNGAMPDVIDQIYPWKDFSIEQLKQGIIPFWNPHSFGGTPHVANYQTAVFSPFNLFYFFLPFIDAWSITILLQPLLAGIGMYLYLRQVKISESGSLLGATAFMFSGFMVVWMAYGTLVLAIAFLPLILYFIEKSFEKKSMKPFIGISIVTTLSYFSGHFQMTLYFTIVAFLYIAYAMYRAGDKKSGLLASFSVGTGILLAMIQVLPSLEFYQNALRSSTYHSGGGMPFYNLVTAFAPDFFGNPVTRNNKFMDYAEWQSFVGIIPLFLAACIIFKKKSLQIFFLICAITTAILSVASPLQELISLLHIPVISTSIQSRIIVLFSFSVSVLAGFGYDALWIRVKEKNYRAVLIRIVFFSIVIFAIWAVLLFGGLLPIDEAKIAQKNLILPTGFFTIVSFCVVILFFSKNKNIFIFIGGILLLLVVFDSFRFATKWIPFDPRSFVFPSEKVTTFLQENKGTGRVFGNLGGTMEIYYGLDSVDGYDPLYIQRYGELVRSASFGRFTLPEHRVVTLQRVGKNTDRVLNVLGNSLIFHPVADTNTNWAYPVWKKDWMKPVYSDGTYTIYKNTHALPRAKMFYNYEVIPEKEKSIQRFYTPSFDYRTTLLLEEKIALPLAKDVRNSVDIVSYTPNTVTISVNTAKEGMLFLSDPYYPGWKAFIDGKETKIYRADYAFRAVVVPSGKHTITFTYIPMSFYGGMILSVMGILGIVVINKKRKTMQGK